LGKFDFARVDGDYFVNSLILLLWKTNVSLKIEFPLHPEMYRLTGRALNLFVRSIALNTAIYFSNAFATDYGTAQIAAHTIALNLWLFSAFLLMDTLLPGI